MFDIITVGSGSVDVFVKTKNETRKHRQNSKIHTDICYHLGEKLLIEDLEFNTGGGGTNTAVAFSRLGLKTGYIGILGHDMYAEMIVKELMKEKVEFLGRVKPGKTGYSVVLPGKNDRVILAFKGINNDFSWEDIRLPLETKWLYISSMIGKGFNTIEKLSEYASKNAISVAFNMSLYLANLGLKKLKKILSNVDILIINKDEAEALTGKSHMKEMLETLAFYVNGIIVITNAHKSLHALYGKTHFMKEIHEIKAVDTTGAGDAFASGFVYGIMTGEGVEKSLDYGYREAKSVLNAVGAKNNLLRKL